MTNNFKIMTKEDLAKLLNGRQALREIDNEEELLAQDNGLVVVFGYSDDLTMFRGAIDKEVASYYGCTIKFTKQGIFKEEEDEDFIQKYQLEKNFNKIEAIWDDYRIAWTYNTDIPHETFEIFEVQDIFCRGIIFSIDDLK